MYLHIAKLNQSKKSSIYNNSSLNNVKFLSIIFFLKCRVFLLRCILMYQKLKKYYKF